MVLEITSRSSSREDSVFKPRTYEQLGVRELFLYDPTAEYLLPSLKGFRLAEGGLNLLEQSAGKITSEVLGLDLSLRDARLVLVDSHSGEEQLTRGEAEQRAREAEQRARETERAGREAAEAELSELRAELQRLRREQRGGSA